MRDNYQLWKSRSIKNSVCRFTRCLSARSIRENPRESISVFCHAYLVYVFSCSRLETIYSVFYGLLCIVRNSFKKIAFCSSVTLRRERNFASSILLADDCALKATGLATRIPSCIEISFKFSALAHDTNGTLRFDHLARRVFV